MTASVGELETALQRTPDAETFAVYADALEAAGDPRGELIAIDLELARVRKAPPIALDRIDELTDRKRAVLRRWLGDTIGGIAWHPRQFEYGLLRDIGFTATSTQTIAEYTRGVLDSPIGTYLSGVEIYGSKAEIEHVMALVAKRPLPWLRRLTIHRVADHTNRTLAHDLWEAFVAATPNLVDVSVIGPAVARSPIHPNIRTLRMIGGHSIVIGAEGIPGVTTLDLAFRDPEDFSGRLRTMPDKLAAVVNRRAFPALRTLDLARNEGAPDIVTTTSEQAGAHQVRRRPLQLFLDAVEELDRFERLRLPSIDRDTEQAMVLGLLDAHPSMTIEIARMWTARDDLAHPRLHVPASRLWEAPGAVHGRQELTIAVPGYTEDVALSSMVRHLDEQFDDMPPDAQDAWRAVWRFLADARWEPAPGHDVALSFDALTLRRAFEALDGDRRCDDVAKMLREAKLRSGATAMIHRRWEF
jgi:hypothetical protein